MSFLMQPIMCDVINILIMVISTPSNFYIMAARFDQKEIQRLVEGVPTEAKGGLQGDIDV